MVDEEDGEVFGMCEVDAGFVDIGMDTVRNCELEGRTEKVTLFCHFTGI